MTFPTHEICKIMPPPQLAKIALCISYQFFAFMIHLVPYE